MEERHKSSNCSRKMETDTKQNDDDNEDELLCEVHQYLSLFHKLQRKHTQSMHTFKFKFKHFIV